MSRRTVRLTLDLLAALPDQQRACLFWELAPVDRARLEPADRFAEKEAWVSTVLREWGSCGRVALDDGHPVGLAIYAPPAWLPGSATMPTAPPSPDAVLLASIWVAPTHRGRGLGRMLVQGMARDLVERGQVAVEAFGDTRGIEGCVAPADFWGSVGFKTQRAHATTPRVRMELRSTLSWKDEVEQALERLWGAVRPAKQKATRPIGGSARVAPRQSE
jgi:GNAT superfamily N-acetyltransferase